MVRDTLLVARLSSDLFDFALNLTLNSDSKLHQYQHALFSNIYCTDVLCVVAGGSCGVAHLWLVKPTSHLSDNT